VAGLVPCPISVIIMLMAVSLGAYLLGLLAVLGISVGIAALLTAVGLIAIRGRSALIARMEKRGKPMERVHRFLDIGSAILIILLGLALALLYLPLPTWL
jgi:ABC-type nickel/cobalt efflux system permease component RcnA